MEEPLFFALPPFMAPRVLVFFIVGLEFLAVERALLPRAVVVDFEPAVLLPALLLEVDFFAAPLLAPPSSLSEALPPLPLAGETERSAAGTPRFVARPRGFVVAAATPARLAAALFVRASSFWFGFARLLWLLVAVAIRGSFICDDFAIPIFVPSADPLAPVTRGFEAAPRVFALLVPAGADFSIASREPEADFTLPAPVITAEGFFLPPAALEVDLTACTPGFVITASLFVFRVVASLVGAIIIAPIVKLVLLVY